MMVRYRFKVDPAGFPSTVLSTRESVSKVNLHREKLKGVGYSLATEVTASLASEVIGEELKIEGDSRTSV